MVRTVCCSLIIVFIVPFFNIIVFISDIIFFILLCIIGYSKYQSFFCE